MPYRHLWRKYIIYICISSFDVILQRSVQVRIVAGSPQPYEPIRACAGVASFFWEDEAPLLLVILGRTCSLSPPHPRSPPVTQLLAVPPTVVRAVVLPASLVHRRRRHTQHARGGYELIHDYGLAYDDGEHTSRP